MITHQRISNILALLLAVHYFCIVYMRPGDVMAQTYCNSNDAGNGDDEDDNDALEHAL